MYYLNSRYYNPEWGRFINADSAIGQIGNIQGHNMFQYCFNNPVNMDDSSGHWPKLSTILITVAVVATVVAVATAVASVAFATAKVATAGAVVAKSAEVVSDKVLRREHTVYKLTDDSKTTQYVGRTKNPGARESAHNASNSKTAGLKFTPIKSNLTYFEAEDWSK